MASVTSNRSKYSLLGTYFLNDADTTPPGFAIALITAGGVGTSEAAPVAPTASNCLTWNDCAQNEIPAGNGYVTGGIQLPRDNTAWTSFVEDDANNRALVGLRNISWTAAGGNLPISGGGAAYAVIMDTSAAKNVVMVLDLGGSRTVSDTQQLILQNVQYIAT